LPQKRYRSFGVFTSTLDTHLHDLWNCTFYISRTNFVARLLVVLYYEGKVHSMNLDRMYGRFVNFIGRDSRLSCCDNFEIACETCKKTYLCSIWKFWYSTPSVTGRKIYCIIIVTDWFETSSGAATVNITCRYKLHVGFPEW